MSQHTWSIKDTFELIKRYKANMLLWDSKHWQYKDKEAKRETINNIALAMSTTSEEVVRKLHNLRCQLCQEMKKLKSKKGFKDKLPTSSWCYFSVMKFLIPTISNSRNFKNLIKEENSKERNTEEYKNLDEIEERYEEIPTKFINNTYNEKAKPALRFSPKERNAIAYQDFNGMEEKRERSPAKYINVNYDEEPRHSLRIAPRVPDEDDQFGEYVALELRGLRSEVYKRRLKSEIRRAICHIVDLDDANILIPNVSPDSSSQYSQEYSQICEITDVKSEVV